MGGAKTQDLQNLGDLMKIAGPLLEQLAPIAIDALKNVGQEQDLQLGGLLKLGLGLLGGQQQDLQLGGLLKLGLGLLGGIKAQQEDLGFKAGFKGGVNWGAQQDQDFGLFGSILKTGMKLGSKGIRAASKSDTVKYALKKGGRLAVDAADGAIRDRFNIRERQ